MVIFTDSLFPGPGAFVSPTAPSQFPWGYKNHDPSGLEKQCQAVLKALLAVLCPIPPVGQLALLPSLPSHCSSKLCLCPPGVPQPPAARPPSALPWHHPMGLPLSVSWGCASESTCEWGSKFITRNLLGRREALLCSPVLYQGGPTLISAGFLGSANEHWVFTHWVLCSLTCML